MPFTYSELRDKLRLEVWPYPGEPHSLRVSHDAMFAEALSDISKWVDCAQTNNIDKHPFCATFFECGKTIVSAPKGIIRRVYSIANKDDCDKVSYEQVTWEELECWAKNSGCSNEPANDGTCKLPRGYREASDITDLRPGTEKPWPRARAGSYAIHNKRLYVAPWLQSNETLYVEWDGKRNKWPDDVVLDERYWGGEDVKAAIKHFVTFRHETTFGCDRQKAKDMKDLYDTALADLIYDCREETRVRKAGIADCNARPSRAEIEDDVPTVDVPPVIEPCVTGSLVADSGPEGFDGTLVGEPNPEQVVSPFPGLGNAFQFNGQNVDANSQGINIGPAGFSGVSPFTVEAKIRTGPMLAGNVFNVIAGRVGVNDGQSNWALVISPSSQAILFLAFITGVGFQGVSSVNPILPDTNYTVRGVFDGDTFYIYINGVRELFLSASGPAQDIGDFQDAYVGRFANNDFPYVFDGTIDEVRLSNVARSTGASYTVDAAPFASDENTVRLYHFDACLPPAS